MFPDRPPLSHCVEIFFLLAVFSIRPTSLAVEGMELTDDEDIVVADEPEDFARALIDLYELEELWKRLSENGIKKTKADYSIEAARNRLRHLFSDKHIKLRQGQKLRMLTAKIESAQSLS